VDKREKLINGLLQYQFMNLERELKVAKRLALAAGSELMSYRGKEDLKRWKNKDGTPVTEADKASNKIIVLGLKRDFSDYSILSEESVDDLSRLDAYRVWCVDPLDGTRKFPDDFGIHIGLMQRIWIEENAVYQPILGVVYRPIEDRLYHGSNGNGASVIHQATKGWAHETPLNVSNVNDLSQANMLCIDETLKLLADKLGIPENQIEYGNGLGHHIIDILEGKDVIVDNRKAKVKKTEPAIGGEWDTCAPEAIVRAAGAIVTDLLGNAIVYNKEDPSHRNGLLVTNDQLHERVAAASKKYAT
jgi:3'(2'), 5'-bisphosphate nucleotidase